MPEREFCCGNFSNGKPCLAWRNSSPSHGGCLLVDPSDVGRLHNINDPCRLVGTPRIDLIIAFGDAYRAAQRIRPPAVQRVMDGLDASRTAADNLAAYGDEYRRGQARGYDDAIKLIEREFPADEEKEGKRE